MEETAADLLELQTLLDESHARAGEHLRDALADGPPAWDPYAPTAPGREEGEHE
ncbi:MAG: hypothetical protein R6X23_08490 [Acidimicrobiia bacterium]